MVESQERKLLYMMTELIGSLVVVQKLQDVSIYSDFGAVVRTEVVHEWAGMVLVMQPML